MAFAARPLDLDGLHDVTADRLFELAHRLAATARLVDGEVVAGADLRHQHIVVQLVLRLQRWIDDEPGRGQCGIPADEQLDVHNVYAPDAWWCRDDRKPGLDEVRLPALPDLAVEVLCPSTRRYDLRIKRSRYEQLGLPELWIVDPTRGAATLWRRSRPEAQTFDVTTEIGPRGTLASPQLPGFGACLGELLD